MKNSPVVFFFFLHKKMFGYREESFAKPVCHMACAGTSHKCPLSSQPSGFRLPSCGSSFPKLPLLLADYNKDDSFTVWTALSWPGNQTHTHTYIMSTGTAHTRTSHRVNSRLRLSWAVWWLTGWNMRINGYLYFIMFLYWPQNKVSLSGS